MLPLIALKDVVTLPNIEAKITVGRSFSINASLIASSTLDKHILLALQKDVDIEFPRVNEIKKYGVLAELKTIYKYEDDVYKIVINGISRVSLNDIVFNEKDNCFYSEYKIIETDYDIVEDERYLIDSLMKSISSLPLKVSSQTEKK